MPDREPSQRELAELRELQAQVTALRADIETHERQLDEANLYRLGAERRLALLYCRPDSAQKRQLHSHRQCHVHDGAHPGSKPTAAYTSQTAAFPVKRTRGSLHI